MGVATLLNLEDLNVHYGAIWALKGVNLTVGEGEIVSLIGANGAGKSTTLRAISGVVKASSGGISFQGEDITKVPAHDIVKKGIAQVPEGRRVFANLSVLENLELGAYIRRDTRGIKRDLDDVLDRFPRLKERIGQVAGTLSGGEQQMLAIGRALMTRPKLMLLDEPSMGLAPLLVKEIFSIIREINEEGTTILLVEQNARMALQVASRAYVLETGRIVLDGLAKELAMNEDVKKAYLGG
ncbi:MAG TPA: ABC transporter ATP-binding protein [Syntrophaceticus sp.]|jgi:branched-chain amino acid transport system ATP-binding protein|uniref:Leucine/isoleucine/valine transporter subunit ATP-binding component of ABC superfamily n=1 Tax=Syntrophaceticus schinkii TaxID=499207 RepID=A0A0B7MQY1_9FIRM|nr:ABC transporter ATP-binding protein [Syntrophaceticus schinkii]HHY30864.1 ABC transporter ATP-binding protein [Syntrophaceticus sp.]MDD2359118.1 ABC transporter ATP-binding protein [Syntrophaceticus schinkii]MDD4260752.1 ABC transporter ATP-binding protein [Syntrophaceticus schinkii]MDD4674625.1 ABC transporter ATP-binding protein [Syntrophaceticus schinkii]CEO90573.1 leucine/isoleucine/valine transporter subunit; ATP-binding component of ABC superfamily [Syntrophaceticus schinkii]